MQLQAGNVEVPVQKLWERYFQKLVGLARGKLRNSSQRMADEEDVALSAFDSFCQGVERGRFPQLNDRNDLWAILVTITARKAYQLNRHAKRQKRGGNLVMDQAALVQRDGQDKEMGLEQFLANEPTPEFAAQAAEEYRRLLASLGNEQLREVAQLKMEGFTNEEIAVQHDCVPRTVYRRLQLIRALWSEVAP
jgi:DNA-directed RNA polymerase specialized sigma24 family protein